MKINNLWHCLLLTQQIIFSKKDDDVDVLDLSDDDSPGNMRDILMSNSMAIKVPCSIHSGSRKRKTFHENRENNQMDNVEFKEVKYLIDLCLNKILIQKKTWLK